MTVNSVLHVSCYSLNKIDCFAGAQCNLVSENKQAPWFVMEIEFRGEKYLGSGSSKKDAKHNAAANALGLV